MKMITEYTWGILILLTVFAFLLRYLTLISTFMAAILFISTFIKGLLIIENFMGLNEIRLTYRIIPTLWLFLVLCLIAIAYYLPSSTY